MEWSKDQIKTLIYEYESHPCLWDVMSKDYKNRNKKKEAWRDIAENLGLDTEAVDKKMKCILVQYRRERRKVAESISSGTDDIKIPKWFAFENLQFLDKNSKVRKALDAFNEKLLPEELDEEDGIHDSDCEDIKPLQISTQQGARPEFIFVEKAQDRIFKMPEELSLSDKRKKIRYDKRMDQACNVMESVLHMKKHKGNRDEFTAYGEVVGMKIRNLPTQYERSTLQHKINTLLFEAEMGNFRHPNSNSTSHAQNPVEILSDSTEYTVTQSPTSMNSPVCNIIISDITSRDVNDL